MQKALSVSAVWPRSSFGAVGLCGLLAGTAVADVNDVTGVTGSASPTPVDNRQPYLALTQAVRVSGPASTLGTILTFAGGTLPGDCLPANGQLLPITPNSDLFNALGTTYGGDGQTNFRLPDLRGRTAIGAGGSLGNAGASGGTNTNTLTVANLPAHAHSLPPGVNPGNPFTGPTGGTADYNNTQPYLALNYRMTTSGAFPSRDGGSTASPFLAEMVLTASTAATPSGFTPAGGGLFAVSQNVALFSVLGTTYGGNGQTTYAVPDLRNRTAIGSEGNANGPGLTPRVLGETPGTLTTSLIPNQLPAHTHSIPPAYAGPNVFTGSTGQGLPVNNVENSLGLNYIIALQGVVPNPAGGTSETSPFLGEIRLFAGDFAPSGYAFCSGQLLSIQQNLALFGVLGDTYGGNGTTTFALPDLRGRIVIGSDGLNIPLGGSGGVETYSLALANLPAHSHAFTAVPEPAALGLFGVAAMATMRRRRRDAAVTRNGNGVASASSTRSVG